MDKKLKALPNDAPPPFELVKATDLTLNLKPIQYLIDGYIPEKSLAQIFGETGSGKSFLVLDMAFCVGNGIDWHGRETRQGNVVYIAGEGHAGLGQRIKALELKYKIPADNLVISTQPANLTDETGAKWVAESIASHTPSLIIIDTLSRNFGGKNENATQDMGEFIMNIDLHIKQSATVLIVHHPGHVEKGRARGAYALMGALDVNYQLTNDEGIITLINTKAKEFEPPVGLSFKLATQEIGFIGRKMSTSLVLDAVEWQEVKPKKARLSGKNEAVLTALHRAIRKYGVEPLAEIKAEYGGFGSWSANKKVVHTDDWKKEALKSISVNCDGDQTDAKRKAFGRAQDALLKGYVQHMNGFWWAIND